MCVCAACEEERTHRDTVANYIDGFACVLLNVRTKCTIELSIEIETERDTEREGRIEWVCVSIVRLN